MTHQSEIEDHRLTYAIRKPTPNHSGRITPKFIVMHYTAGATAESAIQTFQSASSRVSAHLTLGKEGEVYQHAPFNIKTWHAGPSTHMGYSGLNGHSIGIEIVNVGWLRKESNQWARRDGNGRIVAKAPFGSPGVIAANPRVGSGEFFWPEYPEVQLAALADITEDILEEYDITDIVSHEEIDTRGWKTDPGPAFPMERFKKLLHANPHRDLDADSYEVTASSLNVRWGPGTDFGVKGSLRRGERVEVIDTSGVWKRVDASGDDDGWVHGSYLRRI